MICLLCGNDLYKFFVKVNITCELNILCVISNQTVMLSYYALNDHFKKY